MPCRADGLARALSHHLHLVCRRASASVVCGGGGVATVRRARPRLALVLARARRPVIALISVLRAGGGGSGDAAAEATEASPLVDSDDATPVAVADVAVADVAVAEPEGESMDR